jgi:hypothetical protein
VITASRDSADQVHPPLELCRADFATRCTMWQQDLTGFLVGGFCQGIEST